MKKLPKSVRAGYATYKIEEWPSELATAAQRLGEADHLNHIIRVRTDLNHAELANTLLHEVLHCAYQVGAAEDGDEEKIVTIMANQLTQIIQDNPKLWKWITKAARA